MGEAAETEPEGGADEPVGLLRTREVLARTGISHQILYRYVTLGLIEEAGSTPGGQRLFHPTVIPLIDHIQGLTRTGYSLRDLKEIFFKERRVQRACHARETAGGGGLADGRGAEARADAPPGEGLPESDRRGSAAE